MTEKATERRQVQEFLLRDGIPDFPEKLMDLSAWAEEWIAKAPVPREEVFITIESESGWEDSHFLSVNIYYYRDETDQELQFRLDVQAWRKREEEARRRETYETLKKEFGD